MSGSGPGVDGEFSPPNGAGNGKVHIPPLEPLEATVTAPEYLPDGFGALVCGLAAAARHAPAAVITVRLPGLSLRVKAVPA